MLNQKTLAYQSANIVETVHLRQAISTKDNPRPQALMGAPE